MTRTKNNLFKVLISVAVVMLMSVSMILPALAEGEIKYAEGNPVKASITKILKMPIDTPVKAGDFVFEFKKVGMIVDNKVDDTRNDGMPVPGPITITFTGGEDTAKWKNEDNTIFAAKESGDILAGLTSASWINGEGIYRYLLKEKEDTLVLTDKERDRYSEAEYEIEIWIEKAADGTLFARYISAKITKNYDEYYEEGDVDNKIDPTTWGKEWTDITDLSELIFTNNYWKTDGKDPNNTALEITKTTTGTGASFSELFEFTVTVTKPSIAEVDNPYVAYIYEGTTKITDAENYEGGTYGPNGEIYFTSGLPEVVWLSDGQRLVFVDLHIGSTVEVMEKEHPHYKPEYVRTFGKTPGTFTATAANTPWGFHHEKSNDKGPHYIEEGVNHNKANFTNYRTGATPTGLDVNDLPYIVLIGVAAAGLAAFVVMRSRKRADEDV